MSGEIEFGPRRLLSIRQAANLLGLSDRTIYNRIREGVLPVFKLRGAVRISLADLERYVENSRVPQCE